MEASLVFPHQLYQHHPAIKKGNSIFIIEDGLFFRQYPFHKNKLVLHRASMKCFAEQLAAQGYPVRYISASEPLADLENLFAHFASDGVTAVHYADTTDYLLERRITRYASRASVSCVRYSTPDFICDRSYIDQYFAKRKYFLAKFYEDQRRRMNVLMDGSQPAGGRWSLDSENREKMPAALSVPALPVFEHEAVAEAKAYVTENFAGNYGSIDHFNYPVTHAQAEQALQEFLTVRFDSFGVYQDAIVKKEHFLFHSVLSSSINSGLLNPRTVIEKAIEHAAKAGIPLNSLEGFVRQVLGWREYMRAVYLREGVKQRKRNFMQFTRKLPASFYTATTGIEPVDQVISKVLQTGYAHHIERLMILGNFMLLCEFDPDGVYQWFMELFIDAYDWVMVPNVYGMSQFADGGLMSTKPYISSSNYLLKMSDFKKGEWSQIWDALFWRFMHVHRDMLGKNPRLSMLLRTFDNMSAQKRGGLLRVAENFLNQLDEAD